MLTQLVSRFCAKFNVVTSCWRSPVIGALVILICIQNGLSTTWSEWWSYEGITGPDFWGVVNSDWAMCRAGKRQSPINIDPRYLLFDPHLKHWQISKHRVGGLLVNTGRGMKVIVDEPSPHHVHVWEGPLAFQYRVYEIHFHYTSTDSLGSEHTIDGRAFPMEIQLLAYNSDIYGNVSHASVSSSGLAAVAAFVKIGPTRNIEFDIIAQSLKYIKYKGNQIRIRHVSLHALLPDVSEYVTYEGSLTHPGCLETVTWIIANKPIYITREQMDQMRELMQGDEHSITKTVVSHNSRPTMPLYHRAVRTNINLPQPIVGCTMERSLHYQANTMTTVKS